MQHVIVRWEGSSAGYWLDPRPYQAVLPTLAADLPPGARDYAQAPEHYDFGSERCVKDLRFHSLTLDDAERSASLSFLPNGSKHLVGMTLTYLDVVTVAVERQRDPGVGWVGSVLLDELLPLSPGFEHEILLTGGRVRVVAADLKAEWA